MYPIQECEPECEVLVVRVGAHVLQWQNRDLELIKRRPCGGKCGRTKLSDRARSLGCNVLTATLVHSIENVRNVVIYSLSPV